MAFVSALTCHIGQHLPLKSNNECSLGTGKGRQITSLHKKGDNIFFRKNSPVFGKRWRIFFIFFCCFLGNTAEKFKKRKFLLFFGKRWRKKIFFSAAHTCTIVSFIVFLKKYFRISKEKIEIYFCLVSSVILKGNWFKNRFLLNMNHYYGSLLGPLKKYFFIFIFFLRNPKI